MKIPHYQIVSIALGIAMFTFACGNDDPAREAATQQALETTAQAAQPQQPTEQQPAEQQAPQSAAARNEQRAKDGGTLTLLAEGQSVAKGGEVCVPVKARGFKSIVSVQYSLQWDPKVLKFKQLKGFNLPGLGVENFGRHILDKGQLTHSWYDVNVRGITKGDGDVLYEVCFEAVGNAGTKSAVQFVNAPTFIEIANANSQFLNLDGQTGTVSIK